MAVELLQTETGEVRVETGNGTISEFGALGGKRNARVEIEAAHLKYPVKAWVDSKALVFEAARSAFENRALVAYRIETRRRPGVDPGRPLADLANDEKIRDLAWIGPGSDEAPVAQAPEPAAPSPHEAREEPPSPGARIVPGPPQRSAESPGGARMSTWAYQGVLGFVELAFEAVIAQGRGVDRDRVARIAKVLLEVADEAQRSTYGRVDRADHSHARVRGAVRSGLKAHPVPFGQPAPALQAWSKELTATTIVLLELGLTMLGEEGRP